MLLITLLIVFGNAGVSRAQAVCAGVATYGSDDGSGVEDGTMEADSRGAIVIETPPGELHCMAWKPGFKTSRVALQIDKAQRTYRIVLEKEKL